jgi:hypothetical protein
VVKAGQIASKVDKDGRKLVKMVKKRQQLGKNRGKWSKIA